MNWSEKWLEDCAAKVFRQVISEEEFLAKMMAGGVFIKTTVGLDGCPVSEIIPAEDIYIDHHRLPVSQ